MSETHRKAALEADYRMWLEEVLKSFGGNKGAVGDAIRAEALALAKDSRDGGAIDSVRNWDKSAVRNWISNRASLPDERLKWINEALINVVVKTVPNPPVGTLSSKDFRETLDELREIKRTGSISIQRRTEKLNNLFVRGALEFPVSNSKNADLEK